MCDYPPYHKILLAVICVSGKLLNDRRDFIYCNQSASSFELEFSKEKSQKSRSLTELGLERFITAPKFPSYLRGRLSYSLVFVYIRGRD